MLHQKLEAKKKNYLKLPNLLCIGAVNIVKFNAGAAEVIIADVTVVEIPVVILLLVKAPLVKIFSLIS